MNEKLNLDGLQGIFKDYEIQVKKKARRTIAIIVIVCLFFGLLGFLCGRASAFYYPSMSDFDSVCHLMPQPIVQPHYSDNVVSSLSQYIVSFDSSALCMTYLEEPGSGSSFAYVSEHGSLLLFSDQRLYCSDPDSYIYFFIWSTRSFSGDGTVPSRSYVSFENSITFNGVEYFPSETSFNNFTYSHVDLYSSSPALVSGNVVQPNLDISAYMPDPRSLSASKVYITDNYYLQVEAYPSHSSEFGYVTLTYYDTLGTFTKTLSKSDGIRVSESGEDAVNSFVTLTINPNLVSQYKFTVTSVEYVSSGDFGTKSVSQLDLIFNEDPFPMSTGWDSITSYSTYNSYSSIGVVGGGIATFEIGYLNNNHSLLSWRESTGKVHQPFRLSWIVLPDFLWDYGAFQFADFNLEEMYQLFESYDVVILGVGPSIFNDLYPDHVDPAGVKDNYDFVKSAWQLGLGVDYCISVIDGFESPYRSCNLSDSDETFNVTRSSQCGFIWTRNFLLKQVSWYCGDTSERLLEIESRLVDENDGVLTNIQEKLNYIYEDNNGFINDCLHSLSDISYAINNLDFGALGDISVKLDRIIGYLDFDIDIDINKLVSPWKEIFQIGKGLFDNSQFMWRNMIDSYDVISDGLEVDPNYSDNVLLPSVTGPVPLFPTVAPNPLLPILTPVPTLVPISVGGG